MTRITLNMKGNRMSLIPGREKSTIVMPPHKNKSKSQAMLKDSPPEAFDLFTSRFEREKIMMDSPMM